MFTSEQDIISFYKENVNYKNENEVIIKLSDQIYFYNNIDNLITFFLKFNQYNNLYYHVLLKLKNHFSYTQLNLLKNVFEKNNDSKNFMLINLYIDSKNCTENIMQYEHFFNDKEYIYSFLFYTSRKNEIQYIDLLCIELNHLFKKDIKKIENLLEKNFILYIIEMIHFEHDKFFENFIFCVSKFEQQFQQYLKQKFKYYFLIEFDKNRKNVKYEKFYDKIKEHNI